MRLLFILNSAPILRISRFQTSVWLILTFVFSVFNTQPALASPPLSAVKWATPNSWPRYIDSHGDGLYADIMNSVFREAGVAIERETMPWKRSLEEVLRGRADVTGGMGSNDDYLMSQFPLLQDWEVLLTKRSDNVNDLDPFLRSHRGVWVQGYIAGYSDSLRNKLRGLEVKSRDMALRMFESGRADYYLDNRVQMRQMLDRAHETSGHYKVVKLQCAQVFMVFTKNARGRVVRDFYDAQILGLLKNGKLRQIYEKWDFEIPERNVGSCGNAVYSEGS